MIFEVRANQASKVIEELAKYGKDLVTVEIKSQKRTLLQNNSLHKWFKDSSDILISAGVDMRALFRPTVIIPVTPDGFKHMFKQIQECMFGTKSTTELKKTGQIDGVFDTLNLHIATVTKGNVCLPPFPCKDELRKKQENNN